MWDDFFDIIDG